MGVPVLVLGASGAGKTYSIKNFDPAKVGVLSVEKNRLPFKGSKVFKVISNATYDLIERALKRHLLKTYVIDDSQYLLVNELFDKAKEIGFQKYTDMALHFRDLIHLVNRTLPEDVIVFFLHHTEDADGKVKIKTVGKMLDEKLTVEGLFDIVLMTETDGKSYNFRTRTTGFDPVKTPEGMFESELIPNDLSAVETAIREYYEI